MYTFTTTLNIDDAMMHVQSYVTQNCGYVLSTRTPTSLTFVKTKKPSVIVFLVLLFCFILPAVLYLILAWGKKTCSAFFKKEGKGTQVTLENISARSIVQRLSQFDPKLKELPEGKFSVLWDISPLYVSCAIAGLFLLFALFMRAIKAL